MAEDDDVVFTFGDFHFAPPQPLPINGALTSTSQNDDAWSGFFFTAPSKLNLSNGFSLSHQTPDYPKKTSINFDPFSSLNGNPPDPGPKQSQKPKGALPLSLFSEEEEIDSVVKNNDLNGWFNGKIEVHSVSSGIGFSNNGDTFGNLYVQNQQIKSGKGSDLNFDGSASDLNNFFEEEDDDAWEFMGAGSGIGFVEGNLEELLDFALPELEVESVMHMNQEKQAGQDASSSAGHKPGSSSSFPQFVDLFAAHNKNIHKSNEMDMGFNFNSSTGTTNGFMLDSFPGAEDIGNGNETSATSVNEDDDFDDFIDASQEVGSRGQVVPQTTTAERQFHNGTVQDKKTQQVNDKGALPLSLFSDSTEESNDCLEYRDEMIHKPISIPGNGFISQSPGISINDLISNLYSQAQQTISVESNQKPTGNGVHSSPEKMDSTPLSDNDDWDDNSWEFKDVFSETAPGNTTTTKAPGNVSYKPPETSSNLQLYMDFYAAMREALCFLLSHQLKEEKKAHSCGSVIGNDGKADALGDDIQEAYKLLEDCKISQEALSNKYLDRSTCLNEVLDALQGPNFKVIKTEYSLSKKLQLVANEWRIATNLLKHAISILHILSLGSADEQSVYVSTWSNIINVCTEELKHGALIWKRASEKNVQLQILSYQRGQRYIQALGEIYKVVELLGLSAKFYKPWMFLSALPQFFGPLDECHTLWSSSGLEEALQNISDNVEFGCNEPAKALIASIKNIRDLDVYVVHDLVFIKKKAVCRLSLLPQEMLADLKTVLWNEEPYFLNLANLWANLISCKPPDLPHLQVS